MEQLLWLFDYKIFTPLEIKQNSLSFQWYLKMASVFESHKEIIRVKSLEYQDALRRKIESFKRELELYWEQVQEYEHWGEIKNLAKYKKKASMLHSKWVSKYIYNIDYKMITATSRFLFIGLMWPCNGLSR